MKSFSLHGRNTVATGGSRGIGRAIALRSAEVGSNVALAYRERVDDAHQIARQTEENGRLAVPLQTDVTDPASIDAAAKEARRALGPIWLRINDAGIHKLADFDPGTGGNGDAMLAAIFKGPFRRAQAFPPLPAETKNGAIVQIGSIKSVGPTTAHYTTGKAGLIALGEAIARFGAPLNVRSNVVAAGFIASDIAAPCVKAAGNTLLKRLGTTREVAKRRGFPSRRCLGPHHGAGAQRQWPMRTLQAAVEIEHDAPRL
jgi:3-oxoacyl-[acyl-carrier protein] reductase